MRRIILFVFALLTFLPVIGQEISRPRSCRPLIPGQEMTMQAPRRASAHREKNRAPETNPYIGERRQIVVMVEFADKAFKGDSAQTMEQWNKILNTRYLSEGSFYGSVHDYFYDQSYGKFDLSFDLHYGVMDSLVKYHSTSTSDLNAVYLVQDVVEYIRDRVEDWAPYDWDGDGKVNQLLIIFAGKGQSDGGGGMTIWPHQWWLSEFPQNLDINPIPVTSGGKNYLIDSYCCVQELNGKNTYGSFGTICHEFSHCLGLPDFYGDESYIAEWDLMDSGNYNGNGFRPCGYSAFERAYMGWLTPVELDEDQTVMGLSALSTQPIAYLVRNEGKADEYYLIENRQQAGWDEMLPGKGILVSHVDYDEQVFKYGQPNNSIRKHYMIFPANNKPEITTDNVKGWAYPYEGNNSLTNTSAPAAELFNLNSDSTFYMNKPVTEMAVIRGMAQFKFQNTFTGVKTVKADWAKDGRWFTIDGRTLPGKPAKSGLYIHEGRVVLVR